MNNFKLTEAHVLSLNTAFKLLGDLLNDISSLYNVDTDILLTLSNHREGEVTLNYAKRDTLEYDILFDTYFVKAITGKENDE